MRRATAFLRRGRVAAARSAIGYRTGARRLCAHWDVDADLFAFLSFVQGTRSTGLVRKLSKPVLVTVVVGQVASRALAWRDLAQRSSDQVRGRKSFWRVFVTLNPRNSVVHWVIGRR